MFPKNSPEHVLIAEPYRTKERFTLLDSKIGGLPVFQYFAIIIRSYGLRRFQSPIHFCVVVVGMKWYLLFKLLFTNVLKSSCMNQIQIWIEYCISFAVPPPSVS